MAAFSKLTVSGRNPFRENSLLDYAAPPLNLIGSLNDMKIRFAKASDAQNIAVLAVCVWVDTYAVTGVFDKISEYVLTELTEQKIKRVIDEHTVVVAVEDSRLLGYMVLIDTSLDKSEIETLYILPKNQRQGVGQQLISKAQELSSKVLWLSAWEHNIKAINFYKKLGFKENGELYFDLYGDKIRNIVLELRP